MNRAPNFFVAEEISESSAPADGNPDDGVTASIADWVVDFDVSPYLSEPFREAWQLIQQYHLLLAFLLIGLGYGLGRLLAGDARPVSCPRSIFPGR